MHVICTLVLFETCRDTLRGGGAEDVVWSSVVSLWQERYGDMLFSCFYDFTEHEESICVYVYMRRFM